MVPRVTEDGTHLICNQTTNRFEPTDGTGFRDWFSDKSRITKVNLKRVVRLLKYLRDHPPPSIVLAVTRWKVQRMYRVELYARVRRALKCSCSGQSNGRGA